jgi:hypothetical protein
MYDGIPIYGSQGDNGEYPDDLDECGGHTDETHQFYHYHLPPGKTFPYTVSYLKGCILNSNENNNLSSSVKSINDCDLDETQYDYSNFYKDLENIVNPEYDSSNDCIYSKKFSIIALFAYLLVMVLF